MAIPYISSAEIINYLPYKELIVSLQKAFADYEIYTPDRHHHAYGQSELDRANTLLVMPSWQLGGSLGIKLVTVTPNNQQNHQPTVQAIYTLFDIETGAPKAILDGSELTVRRTVAASALASKYLSKPDSRGLLIVGTGQIAGQLAQAHATIRPLEQVFIWGRALNKAQKLAEELKGMGFDAKAVSTVEEGMAAADIVSAATLADNPLIFGNHLKPGQHIDLIGSYLPNMREADDHLISRASIYVDTPLATQESGDLKIPMDSGIISDREIKGDLHKLCKADQVVRKSPQEITCFKSVGVGLEDLVAADLVFNKFMKDDRKNV